MLAATMRYGLAQGGICTSEPSCEKHPQLVTSGENWGGSGRNCSEMLVQRAVAASGSCIDPAQTPNIGWLELDKAHWPASDKALKALSISMTTKTVKDRVDASAVKDFWLGS